MKKFFIVISLACILSCKISIAQIILEHVYDHGSSTTTGEFSQLLMISFEVDGLRYVKIDRVNNQMLIYDLNHSLTKTIMIPSSILNFTDGFDYVMYISQHLFDIDDGIEYLVAAYKTDSNYNSLWNVYVLDEDGSTLFSGMNQYPWV